MVGMTNPFSPCRSKSGWYVADREGRLYDGGGWTKQQAVARAEALNRWAANVV
jgi:hypothetical protein